MRGFTAKQSWAMIGTFVEVHRDEVGGDADDFDTLLVSLTVRLRSRKTQEQRGMNVDNIVLVTPNEIGGEDFHETRQHHEINFMFVQDFQRLLFGFESVFPRDLNKGQTCVE
jgi:hypothetical protein